MRTSTFSSIVTALLVAALIGAGPANAGPKGDNIVDVAIAANASGPFAGQLNTLIAALQAADPSVMATLSGNGQFTVFAPTDAAFAKLNLNAGNIAAAFPTQALTDILLYHVARGRRDSGAVTTSSQIRTLQGSFLMVSGTSLEDQVGRTSGIIATDVPASNGIIHVIDEVVLPFNP